jgi:hypothetical protein
MSIVQHVRQKSQVKGSARTLLLNLAIYANDCCGVAWPSDATLRHDINVSHQRIHEVKNALEKPTVGELVIVERSGTTNLYFVAWQGRPLGPQGEYRDDKRGQHTPGCPLHDPALRRRCAQHLAALDPGAVEDELEGGAEISDPPVNHSATTDEEVSDIPDPQGSETSEGRGQKFLTQQRLKTREKKEHEDRCARAHEAKPEETSARRFNLADPPRLGPLPAPDRWCEKTCGRDGCTRPQCPHWQQCASHACCEFCAAAAPDRS